MLLLLAISDHNKDAIHNSLNKPSLYSMYTLYNKSTKRISNFLISEANIIEKSKKLYINSTISLDIIITRDEFISLSSKEKGSKVILVPVLIYQGCIVHMDYNELILYDLDVLKVDNVTTKFSYEKGNLTLINNSAGKVVIKGSVRKSIDYYDESESNTINSKKYALISKNINIISNIPINDLDIDASNNKFKINIEKVNIIDEIKIKN